MLLDKVIGRRADHDEKEQACGEDYFRAVHGFT
jgi:hypothetical protein